jgi:orotidine 5'-phosphate decarboxylase subfamily 1
MLSYSERAKLTNNKTAKKLFLLMDDKKTNLSIAVDVITKEELLNITENLGPEICVLKTHIDIIEDFDTQLISDLQRLSEKHNFLIFEDRKFADIGNTVMHQYQDGVYHIADWSHITNAHTVAGPGTIEGLKKIGLHKGNGLLLLAEMSPEGNLAKGYYTKESIKMAEKYKDFVIGFITMRKLIDNPSFINMTPGVKLEKDTDNMGQQYNTPESVIFEKENDIIIVGRGIIKAKDPKEEAQKYREAGWEAYEKRLKKEVPI